jgi:hypothetical protein
MGLLERFNNLTRCLSKTAEPAERERLIAEFVQREAVVQEVPSTTLRLFDEFERLGRGGPLLQAELARVRELETVEAGTRTATHSSSSTSQGNAPMVFRRVNVDPDVDAAVLADARKEKVSKGEMFRRYLRAGIACLEQGAMPEARSKDVRLVMRSIYLPVDIDEWLRARAFAKKTDQGQLVRQVACLGMKSRRA